MNLIPERVTFSFLLFESRPSLGRPGVEQRFGGIPKKKEKKESGGDRRTPNKVAHSSGRPKKRITLTDDLPGNRHAANHAGRVPAGTPAA